MSEGIIATIIIVICFSVMDWRQRRENRRLWQAIRMVANKNE